MKSTPAPPLPCRAKNAALRFCPALFIPSNRFCSHLRTGSAVGKRQMHRCMYAITKTSVFYDKVLHLIPESLPSDRSRTTSTRGRIGTMDS